MVHERRREVKDPQLRKQEILNQAMILFTSQGYEKTSMRDIARSLNISLGLCYRYFDSKQILFEEAMNAYVDQCYRFFINVFESSSQDLFHKINKMYELMSKEEELFQYHVFFHQPENQRLHDELSIKLCEKITPYVRKEFENYCHQKKIKVKNADLLVRFITYGQIGLLSDPRMPDKEIIQSIQKYIETLIRGEMIPD